MIGESGFGSPSYNPEATQKDAGFGDPFMEGYRDTGFGSPLDLNSAPLAIESVQGDTLVPDDGGTRLRVLSGSFVEGAEYYVLFEGDESTHSAITGLYRAAPIVARGGAIEFYTPMLTKGVYDLLIQSDSGGTQRLTNAVEVVSRYRCGETYALKKFFSPHFKTGKRYGYEDDPTSFYNLEALLYSVGQRFNLMSGRPHTYNTTAWSWGADLHVETTLSFSAAGELSIGGHILSYTGKTATSFTGVVPVRCNVATIEYKTEVTQYV